MSTHEPESSTGSGQSVSCPPRDGQRIRLDLARVTVNLPPKTQAALLNLMQQWGANKTDAIGRALRLADLLQDYTVNGRLVVKSDDHDVEVYLL